MFLFINLISIPLEFLLENGTLLIGTLYTLPILSNSNRLLLLSPDTTNLILSFLGLDITSLRPIFLIKLFSVITILNSPHGTPVTSDSLIILHFLGSPYLALIWSNSSIIIFSITPSSAIAFL